MSQTSRQEYLTEMHRHYAAAKTRAEKGLIIDDVARVLGCHRKHAIRCLNGPAPLAKGLTRRNRPELYREALPAIERVWHALDYPCAERLQPVLLPTAEHLALHGELQLTDGIRWQLAQISRSTLARRLARMPSPKVRRVFSSTKATNRLRSQVPLGRYDHHEQRPGALEIDLVEHNGGSSLGHFAYTLNVVEVVSYFSRRLAVLGRGQAGVFKALMQILDELPFRVWGLHTDNGSEFLNNHLLRFARQHQLEFHRSRPHHKNDSPHVEQRNRQFVREMVGYERFDTPEDLAWLNTVYGILDPYANLFLPTRKLVSKTRDRSRVRKRYDIAAPPFERLVGLGALRPPEYERLHAQRQACNPLALHRQLEHILREGVPAMAAESTPLS